LFIFSLLIFVGSLGWVYSEPNWEPILFAFSSFSVVVFSESHIKSFIASKYHSYKAYKIVISDGKILSSDQSLMEIIRPLCLGENLEIKFTNLDDDSLVQHAKKKVEDENQKYYLLAQVDRRRKKLALSSEGLKKITFLYRKGLIRCEVEKLPSIIRGYISFLYPPLTTSPDVQYRKRPFDIYSSSVVKSEISFIADIPNIEVQELIEELEIKSTQEMCIPYVYSVLQIPRKTLYEYVVPAQIFYGLTRYKKEAENDKFWALHNWAIGPH
jgi:hypothetical protein